MPTYKCEDCSKIDKNGKEVYLRQGDMLLCDRCNKVRFPDDRSSRATNNTSGHETIPKSVDNNRSHITDDSELYHNELLTYIYHYFSSSSIDMMRKTVMSFYTADEIGIAKDLLWETNAISIPKHRRISTSIRSSHEADLNDILSAAIEIDQTGQMIIGKYYAVNLGKIPKCSPEEMNSLAIIERLRVVELQLSEIKDQCVRNAERTDTNESQMSTTSVNVSKNSDEIENIDAITNDNSRKDAMEGRSYSEVLSSVTNREQRNPDLNRGSIDANLFERNISAIRGRLNQRGRGKRPNSLHVPQLNNLHRGFSTSQQSLAHSQYSDYANSVAPSEPGFSYPPDFQKKLNRRRKVIKGRSENGTIRGAPPPSRELFVYRVDKGTTCEELKHYIENSGVTVRDLSILSHINAMFKSFKLTISVSDINKILNEDFWPCGIMVRRYNKPRQNDNDA